MNNKLLGLLGMLGGVSLTAVEIRHLLMGVVLNGTTMDSIDAFANIFWGLGSMFAFWAIFRLDVTGGKPWMRWAPFVAAVGFGLLAISSFTDFIGLTTPSTNPIFLVAGVLELIGLLATAVLTLISRKWAGWRKFAPMSIIVALGLVVVLSSVTKSEAGSVLFGLSWILLGFAVLTSEPALILQDARV